MLADMEQVTQLLAAAQGEPQALNRLMPVVYEELHRLAAARLAQEPPGHTLAPTALVHEAFLRLVGPDDSAEGPTFANRAHFFAAAAEAMRRILVDHARRKRSLKRGGDLLRHDANDTSIPWHEPREDLLALDEASPNWLKPMHRPPRWFSCIISAG